ncbi:hypothetical protein AAZX31_06G245400 [Glycine max]|uniref:Uncharacterized protein n=1 Tax=Glycine max TaxID=3847 RepID=I1KEC6_SOYBN|nr:uncharacterized protein LOC100500370 precursor [Glycine max]KAG5020651.1 hypothetical protein JHK87_016506 [Glycine soja]KAG5047187.1 hypothetical protein JHK86_016593 [Glycine max]KAG5149672.1 hypothetical protein JHK82_016553 [Glycine max]KAH1127736.1 hypothetical protein GYH30_016340 [Glycine max]KAH1247702.1 hypothetical protein GmHk_06G017534 [Glycine max]|eukprot:NP_001237003.2 uncharacterized protein LOC100500370 precursor [Glycine max]
MAARAKTPLNTLSSFTFTLFLSFSLLQLSLSSPTTIHDLLRSKGLPPGLLPEEVKSYTFSETGHLEVFLDAPCLTKYENRVLFEQVVTANLTYGSLIGVEGLQQEELFVWLPVKDIIVNDPSSGLILFDIGLAHKQLSLSLFEDPPHCKNQGGLRNHVRKEKGFFEALR